MRKGTAILGSGPVAESHLRILSRSKIFEPVVIFGRNSDRVSFLSKKFNLETANSLEDALHRQNVRMVDISTSNDLHYSYALAAIKAGKSVILEKPASFTRKEVETLVCEAEKRNLMILVCFQKRFNKSLKQVKSFLEKAQLGDYIHGETRVFMPRSSQYLRSKWRSMLEYAGGGVLIYQAIHDLDLLCLLFGEVKYIKGEMRNSYHSIEVEDTVHLAMEFKTGGVHHFFASTDPRLPSQTETRLVFDKGRLSFNDFGYKWNRYNEPVLMRIPWSRSSLLHRILVRLCGLGNYRYILGEMEEFVMNKKLNLTSSLTTAVEVHRVIEEFYKQARRQ